MSTARIVGAVLGLVLLFGGFLGLAVSLFAMFDPAGTKMADDADPFRCPAESAQFHFDPSHIFVRLRHRPISYTEVITQATRIRLTRRCSERLAASDPLCMKFQPNPQRRALPPAVADLVSR